MPLTVDQELPSMLTQYSLPIGIFIAFIVVGFICEKIVHKYLSVFTAKYKWHSSFPNVLNGILTILFGIWGIYAALNFLPLSLVFFISIRQFLSALTVVTLTIMISRLTVPLGLIFAGKNKGIFTSISIFMNIAKGFIVAFGLLVILQIYNVPIGPMLTALGVGGIAFALALQTTLSNLLSGLHIIASKQVRLGDYVKIGDNEEGSVIDITWRNTSIKTMSDNMIIIPNSKMAETIITNFSEPKNELFVKISVRVSYENDSDLIEDLILKVAKEVVDFLDEHIISLPPKVYFTDIEKGLQMLVVLRAKNFKAQELIKHEFMKRLIKKFKKNSIKMMG